MAPRFYGNKEAKCARLLQPKFGIIKGIGDVVKVTKNSKSTKGEKPFTPSIIDLSRAKDGKVREDVADFQLDEREQKGTKPNEKV